MHVIEELSLIVQTLCWFQNRSFKYCAAFDKLTCLDCLLSNLPLITFQNIARSFVVLIIYFVIFLVLTRIIIHYSIPICNWFLFIQHAFNIY